MLSSTSSMANGYALKANAANTYLLIKTRLYLSQTVVRQRLVERCGGGAVSIVFVECALRCRELGLRPLGPLGQSIGSSFCRLCATYMETHAKTAETREVKVGSPTVSSNCCFS